MGTDDRSIGEYIETQSKYLKRSKGVRNIYYLIISSSFADDFEELVRLLKMNTDVNEVCLLEASALVAIVDQKLRAPLTVGLGSDGIQRLFSSSGKITCADVIEKAISRNYSVALALPSKKVFIGGNWLGKCPNLKGVHFAGSAIHHSAYG